MSTATITTPGTAQEVRAQFVRYDRWSQPRYAQAVMDFMRSSTDPGEDLRVMLEGTFLDEESLIDMGYSLRFSVEAAYEYSRIWSSILRPLNVENEQRLNAMVSHNPRAAFCSMVCGIWWFSVSNDSGSPRTERKEFLDLLRRMSDMDYEIAYTLVKEAVASKMFGYGHAGDPNKAPLEFLTCLLTLG